VISSLKESRQLGEQRRQEKRHIGRAHDISALNIPQVAPLSNMLTKTQGATIDKHPRKDNQRQDSTAVERLVDRWLDPARGTHAEKRNRSKRWHQSFERRLHLRAGAWSHINRCAEPNKLPTHKKQNFNNKKETER